MGKQMTRNICIFIIINNLCAYFTRVGLRGPGEKQLETDKRQMRAKISLVKAVIDSIRTHRAMHRAQRRLLGVPVVALVGYTNS